MIRCTLQMISGRNNDIVQCKKSYATALATKSSIVNLTTLSMQKFYWYPLNVYNYWLPTMKHLLTSTTTKNGDYSWHLLI